MKFEDIVIDIVPHNFIYRSSWNPIKYIFMNESGLFIDTNNNIFEPNKDDLLGICCG
jgi:hypothetical protein